MKANRNRRILAMLIALLLVVQVLPATVMRVSAETSSNTYTFDATTLTAEKDKEVIAADTTFADGYFTSFGELTKRTKSDAVFCVELGKKNASGLTFEVTGTAAVTLWISSTGSSNDSTVNLLDENGEVVADTSGNLEISVTGTSFIEVTYENLAAGKYQISSPSTARNTRLQKVEVVEAAADSSEGDSAEDDTTEPESATSWDFRLDEYTGQTSYNGLELTGSFNKHGSTYGLQIKNGTITVPVPGPCEVMVSVGYNWDISFDDGSVSYFDNTDSGDKVVSYSYTGSEGTVTIHVGSQCTSYIAMIELAELPAEEPEEELPETNGLIDVWDFGAEQLDSTKYNNMLTVDEINSWFPGIEPGTSGTPLLSFVSSDGQLLFEAGGKTNNRLRTTNEALCRHDSKSLTDADGNVYTGYIYSNNSSTSAVYVGIKAYAGDKITLVVGSNGGDSLINFEAPSGAVEQQEFLSGGAKAQIMTFYAAETGMYKIYSTTEKLVLARIYREHSSKVTVTGSVSAPAELSGYSLVFTNTSNGSAVTAAVENGAYSVELNDGYTYQISLADANGYVIFGTDTLTIEAGSQGEQLDLTVLKVDMVTVTGSITGLDEAALAQLKLSLVADAVYVPEIKITGTTYSVDVEVGQQYTLVAEGVNDYQIVSGTTLTYSAAAAADIVFEVKPLYKVTIVAEGAALADLANATFTFTNLNEEGYVYTFTGTEDIQLRDGVYSVEVTNSGIYVQQLTSNLTVNGAAVSKTIVFSSDISSWDFRVDAYTGQASYNGLELTGSFNKHGSTYGLQIKNGTITVPVPGPCEVMVSVGYNWDISFDDGSVSYFDNTNSGDKVVSYSYTGGEGTVTIHVGTQCTSYIKSIELVETVAYKEVVTVGSTGCDYTTINDALDAVRAMSRPNGERVTIEIQPGNYEEMLVIDVPNVTLKNASSNPSIELTNQGVDIAENAVRITWYYGHGYTYYSMGADYKYDETVLQVNKENGYASVINPGAGTATYWNATVVISADGFRAEGIIFENSFNQYISAAAANDVLEAQGGAKEGSVPRADLPLGSVAVQDKTYVERATALAIANNCAQIYFENCKFVGRQDTLYGGVGTVAAFYDCSIYGACDYIYGGMTAVFAKCDLVFNTSDHKDDIGYITAAQQSSGRGYLMYNCTVTSTTPGVDTASTYESKPGYFGRPWAANTAEVVFYNTLIEATCSNWYSISPSLIRADGWLSTLSGESALCGEYGTYEYAADVDNSGNRVAWAAVFETEYLADGTPITIPAWLGDWDAFAGKDLTIETASDKVDNAPSEDDNDQPADDEEDTLPEVNEPIDVVYVLDATKDLEAFAKGDKSNGDTEKVHNFFTIHYSEKTKVDGSNKEFADGYTATQRLNFGGKTTKEMYNTVEFKTTTDATVKLWWVSGGDGREMAIYDANGNIIASTDPSESAKNQLYISEFKLDGAGTYYIGVPTGSNYLFKVEVKQTIIPGTGDSILAVFALMAVSAGAVLTLAKKKEF